MLRMLKLQSAAGNNILPLTAVMRWCMNPDLLLTKSLRDAPWGASVARIMATALDAVEPAAAVHRFMRREGRLLHVGNQAYDLGRYERVFVVGTGKAGAPM